MDIIDIVIAKKKSFTGETETLIQQAQAAMAQANQVASILQDAQEANAAAVAANSAAETALGKAETAATNLESIQSDISAAATTAANAAIDTKISTALEPIESSISNINTDISSNINTEIKKISVTMNGHGNMPEGGVGYDLITTYPDNTTFTAQNVIRMYNTTGSHVNGTMTQEAISFAISQVNQEINNLTTQVNNISNNSSNNNTTNIITNLGSENAGNIVIIDENGSIASGSTSESAIIEALIKAGVYTANGVVGIQIDYANKTFTRTQDAVGKVAGTDFDSYAMYGGRMRCNVADDGTINAFYGEVNYTEDGSNGQVMLYQPKFYYQRTPINLLKLNSGYSIKKEALILSDKEKSGFKLHPMFINEQGEEVDYVLLPTYEGSIYDTSNGAYNLTSNLILDFSNDKLSSIANAKPISGSNNILTVAMAEQLARNRGEGWHITNMAAESVNQMLFIVEFGQLNGQSALEQGIVQISSVNGKNCASLTGSTSELGNTTGYAYTTRNEIDGSYTDYSLAGKRAISYRGMENPWGNIWHFIGGVNIYGRGQDDGGYPYICTNFNYQYDSVSNNYESIGFKLPAVHSWISAMGYGNPDYDWVFMPSECSSANSLLPVGDNLWVNPILNGIDCAAIGGTWESEDSAGPFYYGCDRAIDFSKYSFGAKLMFIPRKNNIYTSNIAKWTNKFGGD